MISRGRIQRGIDIRTAEVTSKRSGNIIAELDNLHTTLIYKDSGLEQLEDPRGMVIELVRNNREFVIRNNPKVIALYLFLDDMVNVNGDSPYLRDNLIDIEKFYMEDDTRRDRLDAYFWESLPENIELGRRRLWDTFQAYDKKLNPPNGE